MHVRPDSFMTLYGQEKTQEELRAAHERAGELDLLRPFPPEEGEPWPQHYSVGWSRKRDWQQVSPTFEYDDWRLCDSWTCEKIVSPSYASDLVVKLVVHISGKRGKGGRLRPHRWSAQLVLGRFKGDPIGLGEVRKGPWVCRGPALTCRSVADAMRRADKLDLAEGIEKLVQRAYSTEGAECFWKQAWDGTWEPYKTVFKDMGHDWRELPRGKYVVTQWKLEQRPVRRGKNDEADAIIIARWAAEGGRRRWLVNGAVMERGPWGYSGCHYPAGSESEKAKIIEELGCWLPKPEIERRAA